MRLPFTRYSKLAPYSIFIDVKQPLTPALTTVLSMENAIHTRKYRFVTHAFSHCRRAFSLIISERERERRASMGSVRPSGKTTHKYIAINDDGAGVELDSSE